MRSALLLFLLVLAPSPARAWNALGHKVIADIAWAELDGTSRKEIVATLRRHPRFDQDFAKQLTSDAEEDRWIFQQAAVSPDLARGFKGEDRSIYDHPTWHYVNFPLFIGWERPLLGVNLSMDYPTTLDNAKWKLARQRSTAWKGWRVKHLRPTRRLPTAGSFTWWATCTSPCTRRHCSPSGFPRGIAEAI